MKKRVCIVTATRAEYGLLKPIIQKFIDESEIDTQVVVTGAHLSSEFGSTYKEIENDGIKIDDKIEILLSSDTASSISKSMGLALIGFADYFEKSKPDLIILLGDRYETLAVAIAAANQMVPIVHLYGGETTEGAIDECFRHAITKFSYLHFTSTEEYRRRVIQLGEHPDRVFHVGAIGIENIINLDLLSRKDIEEYLGLSNGDEYALVTFHPVTLESESFEEQILQLLEACRLMKDIKFIFTKANADSGGRIINYYIDKYSAENSNIISFDSLGQIRYLSAIKYCSVVIGNSSSGIIEAPSFGVPTINIGDRQKGRTQADSIINCEPTTEQIIDAINLSISNNFADKARNATNPYEKSETLSNITKIIKEYIFNEKINLKKKFYDYEVYK